MPPRPPVGQDRNSGNFTFFNNINPSDLARA